MNKIMTPVEHHYKSSSFTYCTLSCGLALRLPLITEAGSSKECSQMELAPLLYRVSTIWNPKCRQTGSKGVFFCLPHKVTNHIFVIVFKQRASQSRVPALRTQGEIRSRYRRFLVWNLVRIPLKPVLLPTAALLERDNGSSDVLQMSGREVEGELPKQRYQTEVS